MDGYCCWRSISSTAGGSVDVSCLKRKEKRGGEKSLDDFSIITEKRSRRQKERGKRSRKTLFLSKKAKTRNKTKATNRPEGLKNQKEPSDRNIIVKKRN